MLRLAACGASLTAQIHLRAPARCDHRVKSGMTPCAGHDLERPAQIRAGWPPRPCRRRAHHGFVVLARERKQAAAGDRAQHHGADHRARFRRHGAHVEHVVLAAELPAPPSAARRCRRGRRPAACAPAVVKRAARGGDDQRALRRAHAVADLARGLQQLRGDHGVERAGHRVEAEHRALAAAVAPAAAGTPRCSRWWRRCAGPRRESRCSARRSRHGAPCRTSHSVSTPPPSPPRAQIRREMGAWFMSAGRSASTTAPRRRGKQPLVPLRVLDHLGAVEARAQRGRMRVLAAQAAAHAAVDHRGHRIHLQRIGVVLDA